MEVDYRPRIFTAGQAIGSTGGQADPTNGYRRNLARDPSVAQGIINGTDDAAKAVRLHYKLGDNLIKIMPSGGVLDESASGDNPQLTLDEIKAIAAQAPADKLAYLSFGHWPDPTSPLDIDGNRTPRVILLSGPLANLANIGSATATIRARYSERLTLLVLDAWTSDSKATLAGELPVAAERSGKRCRPVSAKSGHAVGMNCLHESCPSWPAWLLLAHVTQLGDHQSLRAETRPLTVIRPMKARAAACTTYFPQTDNRNYELPTRGKSLESRKAWMEGCVVATRRDVNPSPHSQVEA